MKVKDFIEFIRPITAINPDTDLSILWTEEKSFDITSIIISKDCIKINLH